MKLWEEISWQATNHQFFCGLIEVQSFDNILAYGNHMHVETNLSPEQLPI